MHKASVSQSRRHEFIEDEACGVKAHCVRSPLKKLLTWKSKFIAQGFGLLSPCGVPEGPLRWIG